MILKISRGKTVMEGKILYRIIRSGRRSVSIFVSGDGTVLVRAPYLTPEREIEKIVESHRAWIEKALLKAEKAGEAAETAGKLTEDEIRSLAAKALSVIPGRVQHFAQLVGVTFGRITIRNQKTRWGSCSKAGNLNFNCLLMLAPPEVLDSVVVHELCHRKYMNHSAEFYAEVRRVYPDYDRCHKWLKEHGAELMARMGA